MAHQAVLGSTGTAIPSTSSSRSVGCPLRPNPWAFPPRCSQGGAPNDLPGSQLSPHCLLTGHAVNEFASSHLTSHLTSKHAHPQLPCEYQEVDDLHVPQVPCVPSRTHHLRDKTFVTETGAGQLWGTRRLLRSGEALVRRKQRPCLPLKLEGRSWGSGGSSHGRLYFL